MDTLKWDIVDDPELNALGKWYDEHEDEINAECDEAERRGECYTRAELGAKDWNEAAEIWQGIKKRRYAEIGKARRFGNIPEKIVSIGLPVSVVEEYKKIAKSRRKPYQRLVNEVLVAGLGKFQRQGNLN